MIRTRSQQLHSKKTHRELHYRTLLGSYGLVLKNIRLSNHPLLFNQSQLEPPNTKQATLQNGLI